MRRQPVAFALVDAAFLADSKWRALRRRLTDPRDFQSAVGAWLIVLTAARRNGLPELDINEEAEDVTFIPDLIAVGLLTEHGIPEKAYRGWAPRRPSYPSDLAPNAPNVTNTPANKPSTPLHSTLLNSENEQDAREELDPLITWMTLTNTPSPRPKVRDWIDSLSSQYSVLRVDAALRRAWSEEPNPATLISRAQGQLVMEARAAERRELEDEKTRNKGKRAPIHFAPLPEVEPTPEEEARLIAEYEAAISGKGAA